MNLQVKGCDKDMLRCQYKKDVFKSSEEGLFGKDYAEVHLFIYLFIPKKLW